MTEGEKMIWAAAFARVAELPAAPDDIKKWSIYASNIVKASRDTYGDWWKSHGSEEYFAYNRLEEMLND
jgi:hypothetical protein